MEFNFTPCCAVLLPSARRAPRKIANKLRKTGEGMTEKYIGKARHYKHNNDLFWKYRDIVLDDNGNPVTDDNGRLV